MSLRGSISILFIFSSELRCPVFDTNSGRDRRSASVPCSHKVLSWTDFSERASVNVLLMVSYP